MSDLISRNAVIDIIHKEIERTTSFAEHQTQINIEMAVKELPIAYDIDKVVEELNKASYLVPPKNKGHYADNAIDLEDAIEIVKQGVVNIRKDCEYRHDNGNCLKVGGFCTSVDDKHCEKMKQGGVTDDVCEWELTDTKKLMPYKTSCGNEDLYDSHYKFCPYCGKKINVGGD